MGLRHLSSLLKARVRARARRAQPAHVRHTARAAVAQRLERKVPAGSSESESSAASRRARVAERVATRVLRRAPRRQPQEQFSGSVCGSVKESLCSDPM